MFSIANIFYFIMKKYFIHAYFTHFLLIICLCLSTACAKKAAESLANTLEDAFKFVEVDQESVTIAASGAHKDVDVTGSANTWKVKTDKSWLKATKVDNSTVRIACDANTGVARMGKVTVTLDDKSASIAVTQSAGN